MFIDSPDSNLETKKYQITKNSNVKDKKSLKSNNCLLILIIFYELPLSVYLIRVNELLLHYSGPFKCVSVYSAKYKTSTILLIKALTTHWKPKSSKKETPKLTRKSGGNKLFKSEARNSQIFNSLRIPVHKPTVISKLTFILLPNIEISLKNLTSLKSNKG